MTSMIATSEAATEPDLEALARRRIVAFSRRYYPLLIGATFLAALATYFPTTAPGAASFVPGGSLQHPTAETTSPASSSVPGSRAGNFSTQGEPALLGLGAGFAPPSGPAGAGTFSRGASSPTSSQEASVGPPPASGPGASKSPSGSSGQPTPTSLLRALSGLLPGLTSATPSTIAAVERALQRLPGSLHLAIHSDLTALPAVVRRLPPRTTDALRQALLALPGLLSRLPHTTPPSVSTVRGVLEVLTTLPTQTLDTLPACLSGLPALLSQLPRQLGALVPAVVASLPSVLEALPANIAVAPGMLGQLLAGTTPSIPSADLPVLLALSGVLTSPQILSCVPSGLAELVP